MEWGLLVFLLGLVYGSFLNVVIYRYGDWRSIVNGRSECQNCKQQLSWLDLVPLLSFITLWGKCRYCRTPLSLQYPAVELLTALGVTVAVQMTLWSEPLSAVTVSALIILILLIGVAVVIAAQDIRTQQVRDELAYILLILSVIFSWIWFGDIQKTLLGLAVGLVPIVLLVYGSAKKWMGEGDVKVAAAVGTLAGYPAALGGLLVAFVSGALVGLLLLINRKAKLKSSVPFAPFLLFGGFIGLFYGADLVSWYWRLLGF